MDKSEQELIDRLVHGDPTELHRAVQMARMYALGKTLQEIGDEYGLTRERVRQIINRETPWTTTAIGDARRRVLEKQEATDREAVQAWSHAHVGASIEQAVDDLGMSSEVVRRYLGRRRARHERVENRPSTRRSDEDLLADLRRFHDETGETSGAAYGRWAKEVGVLGTQSVSIRFGSWNLAATRAGIKAAPRIERERRYSDDDLWAAVLEGIQAGMFTAREFEDWLLTVDGAPSLALIRHRLVVTWNDIRDEALRILNGRSDRDGAWVAEVRSPRDWLTFLEEEDPLDHMRAARLALGKNITMVRYAAWAQAVKRPSAVTLCRRSGMRWGELVEAVGGVTVQKQLRIPDVEILAWLRAFLGANPDGSYRNYEAWREVYGAPGASTIAMRFGGWEKAREAALTS